MSVYAVAVRLCVCADVSTVHMWCCLPCLVACVDAFQGFWSSGNFSNVSNKMAKSILVFENIVTRKSNFFRLYDYFNPIFWHENTQNCCTLYRGCFSENLLESNFNIFDPKIRQIELLSNNVNKLSRIFLPFVVFWDFLLNSCPRLVGTPSNFQRHDRNFTQIYTDFMK